MTQNPDSETLTADIRIHAAARLIEEECDPDRPLFVYSYHIRIVNESERSVRLLSRHWIILDAHNRREEVVGEGVVGRQPELAPGEMFEYTSHCPLRTEWGTMEGHYTFRRANGERFEAGIGRFFLAPSTREAGVGE